MKSNKTRVILATSLVVLLALALGYISFLKYTSWNQENQIESAQYGYSQAILIIAQQAAAPNCNQVPLIIGNETVYVVDINCVPIASTAE